MRMFMKVTIPVEAGNKGIKDGTLGKTFETTFDSLKPEAVYFITEKGKRTALIFFDLKDPSWMVQVAEPLFINMNAEVEYCPAMTPSDLKIGLERFGGKKEKVAAGV